MANDTDPDTTVPKEHDAVFITAPGGPDVLEMRRTRGPGKSAADNGDRSCFHDAENPPVLRPIHCPSALDAMEAVILESHPVAHTQVDVARVVDDE